MEDEEYYRMMMDDLERLERVHHHQEPAANSPLSAEWETARQHQIRRRDSSTTSPWISGIRVAITGAVKAGIDAARRRTSVVSNHSGHSHSH